MIHYISNEVLLLEQLSAIVESDTELKLSEEAVVNIETCYRFLQEHTKTHSDDLLTLLNASFFDDAGRLKTSELAEKQLFSTSPPNIAPFNFHLLKNLCKNFAYRKKNCTFAAEKIFRKKT